VKFPGEIRQTSGCSSKKFARERAKLKKKKEQTEVLEYWEVARNWDGCVPEISVALVCCVMRYTIIAKMQWGSVLGYEERFRPFISHQQ
jgi:hypothetical protein